MLRVILPHAGRECSSLAFGIIAPYQTMGHASKELHKTPYVLGARLPLVRIMMRPNMLRWILKTALCLRKSPRPLSENLSSKVATAARL